MVRALVVVGAAALVAALVVLTTMGLDSGRTDPGSGGAATAPSDPTPDTEQPPGSPPTFRVTVRPGERADSAARARRPRTVTLPSGTDVPVDVATTSRRGLLRVPADITRAGWWDGGARLGDRYGAMVVASHVDSTEQGLGPFAELLDVAPGDPVTVASSRSSQEFTVDTVDVVPKTTLDTRDDLFSTDGPVRLVLVTCAGPFVPEQGGYQDLAVVTAVPVDDGG